jgi:hypothetical protein
MFKFFNIYFFSKFIIKQLFYTYQIFNMGVLWLTFIFFIQMDSENTLHVRICLNFKKFVWSATSYYVVKTMKLKHEI